LGIAASGTLDLNVAKNQNPGTQQLLSDAQVLALFTLSDTARCGIQTLEIFKAD